MNATANNSQNATATATTKLIKQLAMGERAIRAMDTLLTEQATATYKLPLTETDLIYIAKFACNSDTDVTGTTSKETSRATGKSFFELNNELRSLLANKWRYGMSSIDGTVMFKTLQRLFEVLPATGTEQATDKKTHVSIDEQGNIATYTEQENIAKLLEDIATANKEQAKIEELVKIEEQNAKKEQAKKATANSNKATGKKGTGNKGTYGTETERLAISRCYGNI